MYNSDLIEFPFPRGAYLSSRDHGDMGPSGEARNQARSRLLSSCGIATLAMVRQEHTRDVRVVEDCLRGGDTAHDGIRPVEAPDTQVLGTADGIVSDGSWSGAIGVSVADCVPIFLTVADDGPCAVLHSGRKGTGILRVAVDLMRMRYGISPDELDVLIGPSIGPCCYQVGKDVAAEFAREWGEEQVDIRETGIYLDLPETNRVMAHRLGIKRVRVEQRCTQCDESLGSYRRQGPQHYTRMLAILNVRNRP